jgi:tetratricopeptide (TPR) repeat protein
MKRRKGILRGVRALGIRIWGTGVLSMGILALACNQTPEKAQPPVVEETTAEAPSASSPEAQLVSLAKQLEISPENYALYEERSLLYYSLDSIEQAKNDLQKAIELFPDGPDLYFLQGFYAFVSNDTANALSYYQEAARLGCENPENYYQMGQIFFFQGNEALAMRMYEQARELNEQEAIYPFAQGFLEEQRGNHQKALRYYLQSLAIDSSFAKTRLQLHDLYLNVYQNEPQAKAQVDALLQFQPSHPLGRFYEGNYHLRRLLEVADETQTQRYKDELEAAVFSYSISINRRPRYLQARYNRGFCYFLAQNFEPAIEDFTVALEIDPRHLPSLLMMGDIQAYFQDLAQARSFYQRAVEAAPDNEAARNKLEEIEAQLR